MMDEARLQGFPEELTGALWRAVKRHDIWRIKFDGSDPPANVEPLHVVPKEGCVPFRCKGRKHNPLEERFLDLFGKELLEAGVIQRNPQSKWCSPVNPVLKAEGRAMVKSPSEWTDADVLKHYRLTNDYRRVNAMTVPNAGSMPFQATILQNMRGMCAIGVFDQPKCFWQFPVTPECAEMLSFMLNGIVYTPSRVMQGHVDSALYVQSTNEACFAALLNQHLLVWIDDLLVYAKTAEEYLTVLETFFGLVAKAGIKLNPSKSKLYCQEVKWCGRVLNGQGMKQDPCRIDDLCAIPYPTNAGELQQFVWRSTGCVTP
jgi:hypothetical protein